MTASVSDGNGGHGATRPGYRDVPQICENCPIPGDLHEAQHRILLLERDAAAGIASVRAVEERLTETSRQLGGEVVHLAREINRLAQIVSTLGLRQMRDGDL